MEIIALYKAACDSWTPQDTKALKYARERGDFDWGGFARAWRLATWMATTFPEFDERFGWSEWLDWEFDV